MDQAREFTYTRINNKQVRKGANPMTIQDLKKKTATMIIETEESTRIQYHNTTIVEIFDNRIILDSGGYWTKTTKLRMNQTSEVYGLDFYVYQKNYNWYVDYKGETYSFDKRVLGLPR
jgi:hypothetical protein